MTSIFNLKTLTKCIGFLLLLSEISCVLDSCKMTGKTSYTIFVPLGSSFSITATYACTSPDRPGSVKWDIKPTNSSQLILAVAILLPHPVTSLLRSGIEVTINSSVCTLTVHNATMAYNGTILASIQAALNRRTTVEKRHTEYFLKVKVIITGTMSQLPLMRTTVIHNIRQKTGTMTRHQSLRTTSIETRTAVCDTENDSMTQATSTRTSIESSSVVGKSRIKYDTITQATSMRTSIESTSVVGKSQIKYDTMTQATSMTTSIESSSVVGKSQIKYDTMTQATSMRTSIESSSVVGDIQIKNEILHEVRWWKFLLLSYVVAVMLYCVIVASLFIRRKYVLRAISLNSRRMS